MTIKPALIEIRDKDGNLIKTLSPYTAITFGDEAVIFGDEIKFADEPTEKEQK